MVRQLSAVMFADMVGYTALMQEDERRAKAQRDRQRQVLEARVAEFEGKILQYYGDGALSIFQSAIQAVRCAIAIQEDLVREPKVPLRIGIHVGDIVRDQEGVYGDGVNVASRIQGLSVPGGVLISGKVADEVKNHPDISTEPLGEYRLKNVERPQGVFAVTNPGLAMPTPREVKSWPEASAKGWERRRKVRVVGLVAGIAAIAGVSYWAFADTDQAGEDPVSGLPPAREDVVVLPFDVTGPDSLEFLREGFQILLQGSLVSEILQPRPLPSVKGVLDGLPEDGPTGSVLGQEVARQLQADLFAMGSVLPQGDSLLRVTVDLFQKDSISITVASAEDVGTWNGANALIHSLARELLLERSGTDPAFMGDLATDSIAALKHFIVGDRAYYAGNYPEAVRHLREATDVDPEFALAHFRLSQAETWAWEWTRNRNSAREALETANRLSPINVDLVYAWNDFLSPNPPVAETRYRRLTQSDPNLLEAWNGVAEVKVHYNLLRGKPTRDAQRHFETVLNIEPNYGEARFHLLEFAARDADTATFSGLLAGVSEESNQYLAWQAVRAFGFGSRADQDRIMARLQRTSDSKVVVLAISRVLTNLHDFPSAERLAYLMIGGTHGPEWENEVHGLLAALNFAQGRWNAARGELDLLKQDQTEKGRGWALEMEALLSTFPLLERPREELADLKAELEEWNWQGAEIPEVRGVFSAHYRDHEALREFALGLLSLELDDTPGYQDHANRVSLYGRDTEDRMKGQAFRQSLGARRLLRDRDLDGARAQFLANEYFPPLELIPASPFFSRALDRWLLAEIYREQGENGENPEALREALVWYETLSDGWGEFLLAAPAHLRQAQIHEALGDHAQAIEHYRRFEELWARAEEPLAMHVIDARNARDALERGYLP